MGGGPGDRRSRSRRGGLRPPPPRTEARGRGLRAEVCLPGGPAPRHRPPAMRCDRLVGGPPAGPGGPDPDGDGHLGGLDRGQEVDSNRSSLGDRARGCRVGARRRWHRTRRRPRAVASSTKATRTRVEQAGHLGNPQLVAGGRDCARPSAQRPVSRHRPAGRPRPRAGPPPRRARSPVCTGVPLVSARPGSSPREPSTTWRQPEFVRGIPAGHRGREGGRRQNHRQRHGRGRRRRPHRPIGSSSSRSRGSPVLRVALRDRTPRLRGEWTLAWDRGADDHPR